MYLNTRILPTTGYAGVLLFMFIRRELGGTGIRCLFQFTYYDDTHSIDYTSDILCDQIIETGRFLVKIHPWTFPDKNR